MSDSFSVLHATDSRLLVRSCESLLGIASGLIADGELNDKEIIFLSTWLAEHPELHKTWPGEVVYGRIKAVLADGIITPEERIHLESTLVELIGGRFAEDGTVPDGSTALPIDRNEVVLLKGKSFCFTGQFLFGTRKKCELTVMEKGGRVQSVTRKLDFLVVGELASKEWKYSAHGTKIESAIEMRKAGSAIKIVNEAQWLSAVTTL